MSKINTVVAAAAITKGISVAMVQFSDISQKRKQYPYLVKDTDSIRIGDVVCVLVSTNNANSVLSDPETYAKTARVMDIVSVDTLDIYGKYDHRFILGKVDLDTYKSDQMKLQSIADSVAGASRATQQRQVLALLGIEEAYDFANLAVDTQPKLQTQHATGKPSVIDRQHAEALKIDDGHAYEGMA